MSASGGNPFDPNATEVLDGRDSRLKSVETPSGAGPPGPFDPAETLPYSGGGRSPHSSALPAPIPNPLPEASAGPAPAPPAPPAPPTAAAHASSAQRPGRHTHLRRRRKLVWWGIVTLLVAAAAFWRATTTTRMTEETLHVTRMPEAAVGGATASPGATEETPSVARMPEAASPSTQAVTEAPDGGVLDPPLQMDAHDSPSSAGPYGRGRKGATRKPSRRPAKVAGVRLTLGTMKDVSSSDVPALAQALRASLRRQLKQETGLTLTRDDPQYVMSAVLRTLTFRISKSVKTTVTLECSATLSRAAGGGLRFSTSARASLEADEALTGSARRAAAVEALDECVGSLREDVGAYLRSTGGKSPKRRRR